MKKLFIFFLLACILGAGNVTAQNFTMEWEFLNVGLVFASPDKDGDIILKDISGPITFSFGSEVRMNYLGKRLSSGIGLVFSAWDRHSPEGIYRKRQNNLILHFATDYNFLNIHSKIVPFAGLGIGPSLLLSTEYADEVDDLTFVRFGFAPRVGVEFFKTIRLTAEYQYLGMKNNFFNVKLGIVIGS